MEHIRWVRSTSSWGLEAALLMLLCKHSVLVRCVLMMRLEDGSRGSDQPQEGMQVGRVLSQKMQELHCYLLILPNVE